MDRRKFNVVPHEINTVLSGINKEHVLYLEGARIWSASMQTEAKVNLIGCITLRCCPPRLGRTKNNLNSQG